MSDLIVAEVNPDSINTRTAFNQGCIKLYCNKLYQYEWSQTDLQFAWYLVPGQEE